MFALTALREIRNNTGSKAMFRNTEHTGDSAQDNIVLEPGQSHALPGTYVPWSGSAGDYGNHHISINHYFSVWQAEQADGDRVRVSTDGAWHDPGDTIGAYAATGILENQFDALLGGGRTLVINDATLWLLPHVLTRILQQIGNQAQHDGYRLVGQPVERPIGSVPKRSAVSFNMSGVPSDALDRRQAGARYLYRDSGKRYEFTIEDNGVVAFQPPAAGVARLDKAISYRDTRVAQDLHPPAFDLIAASGGRVFAKEKGVDRFYFAVVDEEFIHAAESGPDFAVPNSYFKLDPEFNQRGARASDLAAPLSMGVVGFARHPAAERFPLYRLALGFNFIEAMVVRVQRFRWHLMDTRPNVINQVVQACRALVALFPKDIDLARSLRDFVQGLPFGGLQALGMLVQASDMAQTIRQLAASSIVQDSSQVTGPAYDHVHYMSNASGTIARQSIDYKLVLDIGVGHVHFHQQDEGVARGEFDFHSHHGTTFSDNFPELYRFANGPIDDFGGYIDGTCNYYALVQLQEDSKIRKAETDARARRDAYALLWIDEQTFFTQRWRMVHPDDHNIMTSLVAGLHDDPRSWGWNPDVYWCPFRAGQIGPRSRLAVAAQVLLVTGEDPESKAALLFSINFSFGTIDQTWRWRTLPAPARYFDGSSLWTPAVTTVKGDERVALGPDACVYPQTVRLREDMTIHVQGRGPGRDGQIEVGHWYQRYLPANNQLVGTPQATAPGHGTAACTHLQAQIDQLRQTRLGPPPLDPRKDQAELRRINQQLSALEAQQIALGCVPSAARPSQPYHHPWKFLPQPVFEQADQFSHLGVYDVVNSRRQFYPVTPATAADMAALTAGENGAWVDEQNQISIDTYGFRFDWMRIPWPPPTGGAPSLHPTKPPLSFPSLFNPHIILKIVQRGRRWIAMHWDKRDDKLMPFSAGLKMPVTLRLRSGPDLQIAGTTVRVTLGSNTLVPQPPAVSAVTLSRTGDPRAPVAIGLTLYPSTDGFGHVWRVRMAAFDPPPGPPPPGKPSAVVTLLDLLTEGRFKPAAGGHCDCPLTAAEAAKLGGYCSAADAMKHGTSIWFEDLVGHVSVPEAIQWLAPAGGSSAR